MKLSHTRQCLSLVAALVLVSPAIAQTIAGRVVGVSDGDTLTVLAPGNKPVKVRLHGVDTPERHQPYGARARQFTSDFAFGKQATIQVRDTDRYGRTVGEVSVGERLLNQELVRAGMAWWYRQYAPPGRRSAAP